MTSDQIYELLSQDRSLRLVVIDEAQFAAISRRFRPGWLEEYPVTYRCAEAVRQRLVPLFSWQNMQSYGIGTTIDGGGIMGSKGE